MFLIMLVVFICLMCVDVGMIVVIDDGVVIVCGMYDECLVVVDVVGELILDKVCDVVLGVII